MSVRPRVSVIIPTYQRRQLVRRAIDSALAQSEPPGEILVVDDGSTDGTAEELQADPLPVKLFRQPHRGYAAARNAGIRRSRGDFIALLDSDDQWTNDKLARCVDALLKHPEWDVVYSPHATLNALGQLEPPAAGQPLPSGWILSELFDSSPIHDSTVVFRRAVWERMGAFDELLPVCAGDDFWLRVATAHRFGLIPESLAICGVYDDGLSSDAGRKLRVRAEILHRFYEEYGWQRLDRARVCRRMGKLCLQAGRLTAQQGDIALSARHFRGAVMYRPTWRSRFLFAMSEKRRRKAGLPAIETPALR